MNGDKFDLTGARCCEGIVATDSQGQRLSLAVTTAQTKLHGTKAAHCGDRDDKEKPERLIDSRTIKGRDL